MKLLRSTKSKITEDENGENMPHLEISEVVLVHCNVVNIFYLLYNFIIHLFQTSHLVNC